MSVENVNWKYGIVMDTETSGLDPNRHHMLEIAIKIQNLVNGDTVDQYSRIIRISKEDFEMADPIALRVNQFKWEEVENGAHPEDVKSEIIQLFEKHKLTRKNSVYICQNPTFDKGFFDHLIPVEKRGELGWSYHWLGLETMNFALRIKEMKQGELKYIPFSKNRIAESHGLPPENDKHRAMGGVDHLLEIYEKVVGYPGKMGV